MELLERTEQLASLAREHERTGDGGRLVLVSGEAGAGKSALVHTFVRQLVSNSDVLFGQCDDLFAPRPLGPIADMARSRPGRLATALAANDEAAAFDAFLSELASPSHPAVVVLEDLQWADEATLDLLRFTARRLESLSCLIIATHRDDLVPDHPLRRVVGTLVGPLVTRIYLPALSVDGVRALLGAREDEAVAFHQQTGGNPFYVLEAMHHPPGQVPPTVRDMILARATTLSGAARDALDAASVLGHADAAIVQEVGDCDPSAVDACVAAGLLVVDGGHLAFRHDLTRQAIEDELTPLRRRQLHARALTALPPDTDVVRRAHHAIASEDRDAIVDLATRAGDECVALGAHRQAAMLYSRAAEHADLLARDAQLRLHRARGVAAFECERIAEAVVAGEAVLAVMDLDDPELGFWETWLSDTYWRADRKDEAWSLLYRVIERLGPLGDSPALAYAEAKLACHNLMSSNYAASIEHGIVARAMAERIGREDTALLAMGFYGAAMASGGDGDGLAVMEEVVDRAKREGLVVEVCRTSYNLGGAYVNHGKPDRAVALMDEIIAISDEHDFPARKSSAMLARAEAFVMLGRWDDAVADARTVLAEPDLTTTTRCYGLWQLGRIRARRGDPDPFEVLDPAMDAAIESQELQFIVPVRISRAEAAWLAGDEVMTRSEIEAVLPEAEQAEVLTHRYLATWTKRLGIAWTPPPDIDPIPAILAGDARTVAEFWKASGFPYEAADALADSDEVDDLREAHEMLSALGARPRTAQVARRLRERGARDVKRGPRASTRANGAGLTSRELEVAALLAEGLTNSEIAAKLVLSAKTVDHHVSAVLSKLSVGNRRQVGRAAEVLGVALS